MSGRDRGARVLCGALLAGVLAVAGCTSGGTARSATESSGLPSAAASSHAGFQPGASGAGDSYYPTYGNGGYDVASYQLTLRYDPAAGQLTGRAQIKATATADLSRFNLDLTGLTVESVTVDGAAATSLRQDRELVITPASGLRAGTAFTVDVRYAGKPQAIDPDLGVGGFLTSDGGAVALGEPESASTWFPVNDHPSDKATYRVEVTIPAAGGLSAISNGVLAGTRTANGWTTWTWSEGSPMASYLATLAIGKYRVKQGQHDGRPVVTAVAASLPVGAADRAVARTTEITDFLATQFGPYPFDAYGGIVISDKRVGYALETQTRPVYGPGFFSGDDDPTWVVAHELAHQWYGDSVSVQHWRDIWLNEGFASYAEWLWAEHTGGPSVQQAFERECAGTPEQVWQVAPASPGVANLFSRSVYKRGAMTLQALRVTVGDDAFFRIIKTWAAEKRDGNATTTEFITLAERISGKSLRPLFEAWLFNTSKPPLPAP